MNEGWPASIKSIIPTCLQRDPHSRPKFKTLVQILQEEVSIATEAEIIWNISVKNTEKPTLASGLRLNLAAVLGLGVGGVRETESRRNSAQEIERKISIFQELLLVPAATMSDSDTLIRHSHGENEEDSLAIEDVKINRNISKCLKHYGRKEGQKFEKLENDSTLRSYSSCCSCTMCALSESVNSMATTKKDMKKVRTIFAYINVTSESLGLRHIGPKKTA